MKILILQLARLGDIYLSWPAIRALKRENPNAHITLLTRERFIPATEGLSEVDEVLTLPVKSILEPLVQDNLDAAEAHARLKSVVSDLRSRCFDRVLNFSFSPVSSHLTRLIQPDSSKVMGYSRTEDGFLAIPDDMSAYFYAQVGPGRANRFHLAEVFGTLGSVDLTPEDWRSPQLKRYETGLKGPFVVCHVGASEGHKTVSPEKWIAIFSQLKTLKPEAQLVLIGSENEKPIAEKILSSISGLAVHDRVGQTSLPETFSIISQAAVLVGADSAPMHMASLAGTKCVNLSIGHVNFWETGPRTPGSLVVRGTTEADLASDRVARVIVSVLDNQKPEIGVVQVREGTPSFSGLFPKEVEFQWKLVQAVYQGQPFPEPVSPHFWEAHAQLFDVNQFLIEQMTQIQGGASIEERAGLIDRAEEVIGAIAKIVPSWAPVLRWYQTEKIRIPPGDTTKVLERTLEIQNLFHQVLLVYADMAQAKATESQAPESEGP